MTAGADPGTMTGAGTAVSRSDVDTYLDVIASFASHCADRLFGADAADGVTSGPDGDLGALPSLLGEARSMGLLADPSAGPDDDDFGVWGWSARRDGPGLSLSVLGILAGTCAGLAAAVHAQGIGSVALGRSVGGVPGRSAGGVVPGRPTDGVPGRSAGDDPDSGDDRTVAAVFVPEAGLALDPRTRADAIAISTDGSGGGVVDGSSAAVWAAAEPQVLAVAGWTGSEWMVVAVPTTADGVTLVRAPRRVGLRAVHQFAVTLEAVGFDPGSVVAAGEEASELIALVTALDWLGAAAIALGTARAALETATDYAVNRIQGGSPIIRHAAVRMLLGQASHDLAVLDALVTAVPGDPLSAAMGSGFTGSGVTGSELLSSALGARLGVADNAFRAVSNCVQVLGGYGYMDDYGISKRLRDVSALRARHGNREQLLLARTGLDLHDTTHGELPPATSVTSAGSSGSGGAMEGRAR